MPVEGSPEPLEITLGSQSSTFDTTLDPAIAKSGEVVRVAFLRQTPLGLHLEIETSFQASNGSGGLNRIFGLRSIVTPPPGEYVVVAWAVAGDARHIPYNEPEFLERHASLIEHATLGETGRESVIIHHLLPESAFVE